MQKFRPSVQSRPSVLVFALMFLAAPAGAHFPFVVAERGGAEATVVLSETLEIDPGVKADRLAAGTKLWVRDAAGKDVPLAVTPAEHSLKVRLAASNPGDATTRLVHGVADFGVRQRGQAPAYLLVYYPKAILGGSFSSAAVVGGEVPVELAPSRAEGGGIRFQLLVAGKPAPAGREVKVIAPDGVQSTQKTDARGFTEAFAQAGRYGAWARHWVDEAGRRGDAPFAQRRLYATLVVDNTSHAAAAPPEQPGVKAAPFATLPEGVSSFGAVTSDGWLYVYGGHTATTHNYSTASVSGRFHRINLRDPREWEELPGGPILQGMNLVAHRGAIYRVGGMSPRNKPGEPKDNHSTAEAARFDPKAEKWEPLPPAPAPRSSHDVALVGDSLYALGGWDQRGGKAAWPSQVDVLDLGSEEKTWVRIEQPFVRRALTAASLGGDVYVLGGFDENNQSQLDVDILDARTGSWRKGPPIPGERRNGFGAAACAAGGTIYLSVSTGEMFKLSGDRSMWEPYARATRRAVHRLVPDGNRILIVGGAANQKMVDLIESVPVAGSVGGTPDSPAATAP